MLVDKKIIIKGHSRNIEYYKNLGYDDIECGKTIEIYTKHLTPGASIKVVVKCSICDKVYSRSFKDYYVATKSLTDDYYCSSCKGTKIKKTCQEKYGVDNVMHLDSSKESLKQTFLDNYGVTHYSKTDMWKQSSKDTCQEKYGVDNVFQRESVKDKIKKTNNIKFGVDYPQQSKVILNKSDATNLERYGSKRPLQSKIIYDAMCENNLKTHGVKNTYQIQSAVETRKKTCLDKYGTEYPLESIEIRQKIIESFLRTYGETHPLKNNHYKKNFENKNLEKIGVKYPIMLTGTNIETIKQNSIDYYKTKHTDHYSFNDNVDGTLYITHKTCGEDFHARNYIIYDRTKRGVEICTICNPLGSKSSSYERVISDWLSFEYPELMEHITLNDKTILKDRELDIYLPNYGLAIEFNGTYWHSEKHKDKNYHLDKTERCKEKGIELIHIFEDDWVDRRYIIESIIRNKLNKIETKIFARKCVVKCVESNIVREFLDTNHIQGFSKSSYKLGLYYNDDLVSLMTFGYRKTNSKKEFELIRFCNKLNVSVIGAASKLFKHFIKNYSDKIESDYILSYADVSMFNGSLYSTLGFDYIHRTAPNYFWVVKNKREHRWKYNKQKLIAEGFESSKTEVEIMHERGYYRIYGCGQDRYEYKL